MACSLLLMHEALQLRSQSPQPLHLSVSMTGLSHEKRERNPSTVPTGQMVLHQVRPPRQASTATTMKVAIATMSTGKLFIHTSKV